MCTLIVALQQWTDLPLLVAANRDERLDRPATAPQGFEKNGVQIFAPKDVEAGGTWLGVNEHGLFVGLTNRFGGARDAARRSRGALVLEALATRSPEEAVEKICAHAPGAHNGFHLIAASREGGQLVVNDEATLLVETLGPGVHVATERSFGAADDTREHWVRDRMGRLAMGSEPPEDEDLISILSTRSSASAPFDRAVMRVEAFNYGTRSSSLIFFAPDRTRFLHAEGVPGQVEYGDLSAELAAQLSNTR